MTKELETSTTMPSETVVVGYENVQKEIEKRHNRLSPLVGQLVQANVEQVTEFLQDKFSDEKPELIERLLPKLTDPKITLPYGFFNLTVPETLDHNPVNTSQIRKAVFFDGTYSHFDNPLDYFGKNDLKNIEKNILLPLPITITQYPMRIEHWRNYTTPVNHLKCNMVQGAIITLRKPRKTHGDNDIGVVIYDFSERIWTKETAKFLDVYNRLVNSGGHIAHLRTAINALYPYRG